METERKFLVSEIPDNLSQYKCRQIEQGYLCTEPVVRVRRDNEEYWLTYKGKGLLSHEEYNLPLTEEAYNHLIKKADGNIITKKRYEIPDASGKLIELDIFEGVFSGTVLAEVEFDSVEEAHSYTPPEWFSTDVTFDRTYHNSNMSRVSFDKAETRPTETRPTEMRPAEKSAEELSPAADARSAGSDLHHEGSNPFAGSDPQTGSDY